MSYMMPKYDTPFLTMAAQNIAQGLERQGANRQRQQMGMLAGKANMGDQMALQELYMYSPEMASQIQSNQEQAAQARQQAAMAQQEKMRGLQVEFNKELTGLMERSVKGKTPEERMMVFESGLGNLAAGYNVSPQNIQRIMDEFTNPDFQQALISSFGGSDIDPDFLKEERKYAKESVTNLRKRASEIDAAYNKIEGLMGTIKDPSQKQGTKRIAIASAITNLARILSPGIVTDRDFSNLTGGAAPVASVISYITNKNAKVGEALEQSLKYIDPTNPETFDEAGFLNVAKSSVSAEAPSILQGLSEAKDRATSAGMSEKAFETNFGNLKSITSLNRFINEDIDLDAEIPPNSPEMIEFQERLRIKQGG